MSSPSIAIDPTPGMTFPPLAGDHNPAARLKECARLLRDYVRSLEPAASPGSAAVWVLDNHVFIHSQIRDTIRSLPSRYLRRLPKLDQGPCAGQVRISNIAADLVARSTGVIDSDTIASFAETLKADESLCLAELWAFPAMLKLAIIQRMCAALDQEPVVSTAIRSLWSFETVSWRDFVESASATEKILREDPAQVYSRMDFATRDRYRHDLEKLGRRWRVDEREIAKAAQACAAEALSRDNNDCRRAHVGYYLIGPGLKELKRQAAPRRWGGFSPRALIERWPSFFYAGSVAVLTLLILAGFEALAGPLAWWIVAVLLAPASQAAIELVNSLVSRLLPPRELPCMDFSSGIPDDCQTLVVVPTLILSERNVARLLEDLEIRYLANRAPNLYYSLVTDFPDSDSLKSQNDCVLDLCVDGIHRLNARYRAGNSGPFYLFHRPRRWNAAESKWMGQERKRGKLNDLNRFLLGQANAFDTVIGDPSRLHNIRYVITLDTDTQLPRDTAAKMVGAAAHPLNEPVLDADTKIVREGYALIRPRVSVTMESAGRSHIAQIFSGQTGLDPYTTSVSDVYQDLHGQASFTGKGIYDLRAFHAAAGERFPDNSILSHDLIEGEHARTGLLTSIELVEDYPATYQAFAKRKHRWVRGDWQLLPWLFWRPPAPDGHVRNPLSALSRWKLFDNLRRSLFEISVVLILVAGWLFVANPVAWTVAILVLLQLPEYVNIVLTALKTPERQFLPAFLRHLGARFAHSHVHTAINLILIPHQAFLMGDAILRTLVRRFITQRRLLEWETMAQSELAGSGQLGMAEQYLYISSAASAVFLFALPHVNLLTALVCAFWIAAPVMVAWLNEAPAGPATLVHRDHLFLRDVALRTWRFFADHSSPRTHYLVPDNTQQDPPLDAHHISPTNLGLLLTAQLASHDFGFVTTGEFCSALRRIFQTMEEMPRYRGHFLNWYDTESLVPLPPRYVSSVDSGNLAASLCTLRQGCVSLLTQQILGPETLAGLRDHVLRLRDELPYSYRTTSLMRLMASLLGHFDSRPTDLFYWEGLLTELRDMVRRIREHLLVIHASLENQGEYAKSDELRYWGSLLAERSNMLLGELYKLVPWLAPPLEPELRINACDASLKALFAELSSVPRLGDLPALYDRVRESILERLSGPEPLYPALRTALEELFRRLPDASAYASHLIQQLEHSVEDSSRFLEEMKFGFLFDARRKLLRVGFNVATGQADDSCYDLLASEARTAVFIAIAKGDIPRDAWFRLGRKLTAYRNHRALISWSGTMFEYLMPLLQMRSYRDTLLDHGLRGAIKIQRTYARERNVPWGVSESAYSARDSRMQYQYRAFGVPALSARSDRTEDLVVAPYASMLALMLDAVESTANLRILASKGCLARHGFFEALEYPRRAMHAPQLIRCFMAHHQGMGLAAIDNAILGNRMQERFHLDPLVQATEFLLQERMPTLVEALPECGRTAA